MISEAPNNRGAGMVRYSAPERIDPDSQDMRRTMASDVYAFACVCLLVSPPMHYWLVFYTYQYVKIFTGKHPFHEYPKEVTVIVKLMNGERPARPDQEHCHPHMEDAIWQLIEAAWHQMPTIRPSMIKIEDVLEDAWRRHRKGAKSSNLSSHLLAPSPPLERYIPSTRLGLDVLSHRPKSSIQPVSSFDKVANDVPSLVGDHGESIEGKPFRVKTLVSHAMQMYNQPNLFVELLRLACLDEARRDTVLQLKDAEAQVVVDAIQLVRTRIRLPAVARRLTSF
jgi:hypothetical protein